MVVITSPIFYCRYRCDCFDGHNQKPVANKMMKKTILKKAGISSVMMSPAAATDIKLNTIRMLALLCVRLIIKPEIRMIPINNHVI